MFINITLDFTVFHTLSKCFIWLKNLIFTSLFHLLILLWSEQFFEGIVVEAPRLEQFNDIHFFLKRLPCSFNGQLLFVHLAAAADHLFRQFVDEELFDVDELLGREMLCLDLSQWFVSAIFVVFA